MSRKIFFLILPFLLLISSCSENEPIIIEDETPVMMDGQSIIQQILKLVNNHRKSKGLAALVGNKTAEELSIDHCDYMILENDISHDNFEKRAAILRDKENANSVGENVASGQPDAKSVMDAWLNSTGHKENIEGDFTHIGIAALKNPQGRYYYTQLFYRK